MAGLNGRVTKAERAVFGGTDWIPEFAGYIRDGVLTIEEIDAEDIAMTDDQRRRLLALAGIKDEH